MIVAGTGYRSENSEGELIVRTKVRNKLKKSPKVTTVITGMANGYDLWFGSEALLLGLDIICAKPWAGHEPRGEDRELYDTLLQHASRVVNVHDADKFPGNWVYQKRNEWMVDNADVVLAYMNPDIKKGGTFNCVQYAEKVNKPVVNVWSYPPF